MSALKKSTLCLSISLSLGDWARMGEMLSSKGFGGHYDIILTSESIYNQDSQWRLLECIKQVLQPPHAVVYVASKMYYFGVGGGTETFRKLIKVSFRCLQVEGPPGRISRLVLVFYEISHPAGGRNIRGQGGADGARGGVG